MQKDHIYCNSKYSRTTKRQRQRQCIAVSPQAPHRYGSLRAPFNPTPAPDPFSHRWGIGIGIVGFNVLLVTLQVISETIL